MLMVIVANARVFGAASRCPHADVADGKLEAIAFGNMGLGGRVSALLRLLRGTHLKHPQVSAATVSRLVYRSTARPPTRPTRVEPGAVAEVVVEAVRAPSRSCPAP